MPHRGAPLSPQQQRRLPGGGRGHAAAQRRGRGLPVQPRPRLRAGRGGQVGGGQAGRGDGGGAQQVEVRRVLGGAQAQQQAQQLAVACAA